MPNPWPALMAAALLGAPPKAPVWPPQGAPPLEPIFQVIYKEQGHAYVEETYYVDVPGLRKVWTKAGAKVSPLSLVRTGQVWSAVRMKFLVDIGAAKRRSLVTRNLSQVWPGPNGPPDTSEVQAYLDWQGRELNYLDRVEYAFAPGRTFHIRFNEGAAKRFDSPPLAQALRDVEFTDDPTDPGAMADLDRALLLCLR